MPYIIICIFYRGLTEMAILLKRPMNGSLSICGALTLWRDNMATVWLWLFMVFDLCILPMRSSTCTSQTCHTHTLQYTDMSHIFRGVLDNDGLHLPIGNWRYRHYNDVIISSLAIVYSTVYSAADHRKHQSSASLAFVRGIHRWPVNSPHKGPVTRKMFPFDDVIMAREQYHYCHKLMTTSRALSLYVGYKKCFSSAE